jgi:hypothetical protein
MLQMLTYLHYVPLCFDALSSSCATAVQYLLLLQYCYITLLYLLCH